MQSPFPPLEAGAPEISGPVTTMRRAPNVSADDCRRIRQRPDQPRRARSLKEVRAPGRPIRHGTCAGGQESDGKEDGGRLGQNPDSMVPGDLAAMPDRAPWGNRPAPACQEPGGTPILQARDHAMPA